MNAPTSPIQCAPETEAFQRFLELHRDTKGWFSEASAGIWDAFLNFQARESVNGHMLEIGVFRGKSAGLLAMHTKAPDERCVLLDTAIAEQELRATLTRANPRIEPSLMFLEAESAELQVDTLLTRGYHSFRWLHIDGEHTAGAVTMDLKSADSLLSREGIVCVDDFFSWRYPQITEAVFRYIREYPDQFSLFLVGCNKAYLARPHYVHRYLTYCRDELLDALSARGKEMSLAKTTYAAEMNTFGISNKPERSQYFGPDWAMDEIQI